MRPVLEWKKQCFPIERAGSDVDGCARMSGASAM
jgi:hypothetical protein